MSRSSALAAMVAFVMAVQWLGVLGSTETATIIVNNDGTTESCPADMHERCASWAARGECEKNPRYMLTNCQTSCNVCGTAPEARNDGIDQGTNSTTQESVCQDTFDAEKCKIWASQDECKANPKFMLKNCKKSCGVCVALHGKENLMGQEDLTEQEDVKGELKLGVKQIVKDEESRKALQDAVDYMNNVVWADTKNYPTEIAEGCQNRNASCAFWVSIGECEKNPAFMKINCAPSCKTCDQLDMKKRCPFDPDNHPELPDAWGPGDLNAMFERIVAPDSEYQQYGVKILARPYTPGAQGMEGQPLEEGQIEGPWVVTFDSFLTPTEAQIMIELGHAEGYERSSDVGAKRFDGTHDSHISEGRTSTNAWCLESCMKNQTAADLVGRVGSVTGVPMENYENFQLLRYYHGQKYNVHHDYIPHQQERQCGPRILTFFLYLSDVEEGGGTNFPNLGENGITVTPAVGKALLWPSVLNEDPSERDGRTMHAALPVIEGTKFACNSWIHLRNFSEANKRGCK